MAKKSASFSSRLLHNAGFFNPVLVQAVGICPIIAMATTLKGSGLLALIAMVTITLSEFIASAFLKVIPRWVRTGIYIIIGGAVITPVMLLLEDFDPQLFGSLGIYLPIMAVNPLIVLRCERFGVKLKPFAALQDGFTASIGYAAVLLLVGFVRELLGSGAVLGYKLFEGKMFGGLLLPFGGFLMLGFAAAALRAFISANFPVYLDKKQPKPGKTKAKHAHVKLDIPELPDLTPEDEPFSFEEISKDVPTVSEPKLPPPVIEKEKTFAMRTSEQTAQVTQTAQPTQRPRPRPRPQPAQTQTIERPQAQPTRETPDATIVESKQPQLTLQKSETAFSKPAVSAEPKAPVASKAEQAPKPKPKPAPVPVTLPEEDDELERLLNRSLDDILSKNKEDKK